MQFFLNMVKLTIIKKVLFINSVDLFFSHITFGPIFILCGGKQRSLQAKVVILFSLIQ